MAFRCNFSTNRQPGMKSHALHAFAMPKHDTKYTVMALHWVFTFFVIPCLHSESSAFNVIDFHIWSSAAFFFIRELKMWTDSWARNECPDHRLSNWATLSRSCDVLLVIYIDQSLHHPALTALLRSLYNIFSRQMADLRQVVERV